MILIREMFNKWNRQFIFYIYILHYFKKNNIHILDYFKAGSIIVHDIPNDVDKQKKQCLALVYINF